jgi:hypothetical protein
MGQVKEFYADLIEQRYKDQHSGFSIKTEEQLRNEEHQYFLSHYKPKSIWQRLKTQLRNLRYQ